MNIRNTIRKLLAGSEINALEKTNISQPKPVNFREFAPVVALISLAILLLGIIAQQTWKMRLP